MKAAKRGNSVITATACLAVLLCGLHTRAATQVSGTISSDTVWTTTGSPYLVTGNLTVEGGLSTTLTIQPGVQVRFSPNTYMEIQAELVARGTQENPIWFCPSNFPPYQSGDRWGYLRFGAAAVDAHFSGGNYTSGCILEHVILEYAGSLAGNGAVRIDYSSPYISDSVIRHCAKKGIHAAYAPNLKVSNCTISNNVAASGQHGAGIYCIDSDNVALTGNIIVSNSAQRAGGLMFQTSLAPRLTGNTVAGNRATSTSGGGGGGIHLYQSDNAILTSNRVYRNIDQDTSIFGGGGIWIYQSDGSSLTANIVSNNTAASYGGGLYLQASDDTVSSGNVIIHNNAARGGGIALNYSDGATLTGDIISNNTAACCGGMYIENRSDNTVVSADRKHPTWLLDNSSYQLFNSNDFASVTNPSAQGNVDARNVWWGTRNDATIQSFIYDYYDNAARGVVFYDPYTVFGITVNTNGSGAVLKNPGLSWYDYGQSVQLSAAPSQYWYFSGWSNDLSGAAATTTITVTGNMIVGAGFHYPTALHGVPVGWLLENKLGTNDQDLVADEDGDLSLNWEEYYAGTVPTNDMSVFAVGNLISSGASQLQIRWSSVSNRYYALETCSDLIGGQWQTLQGNIQDTAPLNTATVNVTNNLLFYRIRLE